MLIESLHDRQLQTAYELLESGQKLKAARMLRLILRRAPNDYKAWWLYANAAPDEATALHALGEVLRLKPSFEKARQMAARLRASNLHLQKVQANTPLPVSDLGRRVVTCRNCGAETAIEPGIIIDHCAFCYSDDLATAEKTDPRAEFRADYIIPFRLDRNDCHLIAEKWLERGGWMVPYRLRKELDLGLFVPIYLPFWVVNADIYGSWKLHTYDEDTGEAEVVAQGELSGQLKNFIYPASTHYGEVRVRKIGDYRLGAAVAYSPEAAAGYRLQLPDLKPYEALEDFMQAAHQAIYAENPLLRGRAADLYPRFENQTWHTVMVPAYIATYVYAHKVHTILVNGQSGAISGQRPVDWAAVWLSVLAIMLPAVFCSLSARDLRAIDPGLVFIPMLVLAASLLSSLLILRQAFRSDDL
jgi:hypothetical protein